jgi:hypothetical protein
MNIILIKMSAIVAVALMGVASAGAASAQGNAKLERCRKLHGLIERYQVESIPQHNSGPRVRSNVSEALCESGDYDRGIAGLETELRRAGIPIPPPN